MSLTHALLWLLQLLAVIVEEEEEELVEFSDFCQWVVEAQVPPLTRVLAYRARESLLRILAVLLMAGVTEVVLTLSGDRLSHAVQTDGTFALLQHCCQDC